MRDREKKVTRNGTQWISIYFEMNGNCPIYIRLWQIESIENQHSMASPPEMLIIKIFRVVHLHCLSHRHNSVVVVGTDPVVIWLELTGAMSGNRKGKKNSNSNNNGISNSQMIRNKANNTQVACSISVLICFVSILSHKTDKLKTTTAKTTKTVVI